MGGPTGNGRGGAALGGPSGDCEIRPSSTGASSPLGQPGLRPGAAAGDRFQGLLRKIPGADHSCDVPGVEELKGRAPQVAGGNIREVRVVQRLADLSADVAQLLTRGRPVHRTAVLDGLLPLAGELLGAVIDVKPVSRLLGHAEVGVLAAVDGWGVRVEAGAWLAEVRVLAAIDGRGVRVEAGAGHAEVGVLAAVDGRGVRVEAGAGHAEVGVLAAVDRRGVRVEPGAALGARHAEVQILAAIDRRGVRVEAGGDGVAAEVAAPEV